MKLSAILRRAMTAPDDLMLEASAGGELLVARIRLGLAVTIVLAPILAWMSGSPRHEFLIGLVLSGIGVIVAVTIYLLVSRGARGAWIRFVTSGIDVTLVTLALASFLLAGHPHTAVNSLVVWEIYLLAIVATALRGDPRVCLFAGLLAVAQYAGIVALAIEWDLNASRWSPYGYGMFRWSDQISRMVLMLLTAALTSVVVVRTQRLVDVASRDPLTLLYNRTYFRHRLELELARAQKESTGLAIALVDLDDFKRVNDTMGHAAGDVALDRVASALEQHVADDCLVARYGGDEFVVLAPERSASDLADAMEAVRQLVVREDNVGLSISVGIAAYPRDGLAMQPLIDAADGHLMQAKQWGRNRVVGA